MHGETCGPEPGMVPCGNSAEFAVNGEISTVKITNHSPDAKKVLETLLRISVSKMR